MKRAPAATPRPKCLACRKPLRRVRLGYNSTGTGADGLPSEWGDYGDNVFCGITCGWRFAIALVAADRIRKVGP